MEDVYVHVNDLQLEKLTEAEIEAIKNADVNQPTYPESALTEEQIRHGGSLLYLLGK